MCYTTEMIVLLIYALTNSQYATVKLSSILQITVLLAVMSTNSMIEHSEIQRMFSST